MTQAVSAHLGESLGTDFFSVREQFTDEQWEHFITVRRFVDEEVVPVVGPYWERAEICWPLVRRLPELGIVGEDIGRLAEAGRLTPTVAGLARDIPRATRVVIPDCGHIPHLEVPDQFFAEFLPFLASRPD